MEVTIGPHPAARSRTRAGYRTGFWLDPYGRGEGSLPEATAAKEGALMALTVNPDRPSDLADHFSEDYSDHRRWPQSLIRCSAVVTSPMWSPRWATLPGRAPPEAIVTEALIRFAGHVLRDRAPKRLRREILAETFRLTRWAATIHLPRPRRRDALVAPVRGIDAVAPVAEGGLVIWPFRRSTVKAAAGSYTDALVAGDSSDGRRRCVLVLDCDRFAGDRGGLV